jgi:hypothetical protein
MEMLAKVGLTITKKKQKKKRFMTWKGSLIDSCLFNVKSCELQTISNSNKNKATTVLQNYRFK